MSHTKEQEDIVKLVLSYRLDQYYEILLVPKSADATTIKKSYRKLAVRLHPDKNPHPRADEAFKIVNKAWLVLSDDSKKRIYDQTGRDPGSRDLGMGLSSGLPFASGFQARGAGLGAFEEELFNMFFGGSQHARNMPAGFSFGNQGFSFQTFGADPFARQYQRQPRPQQLHHRRQQQQRPQGPQLYVELGRQLLPLLFVITVPLLLGLFASLGPKYLLQRTNTYEIEKHTPTHQIPYYVARDYDPSARDLRALGRRVEKDYIEDKSQRCQRERMEKQRMIDESYGWFFTDEAKLERARLMPLPSCMILQNMNLL